MCLALYLSNFNRARLEALHDVLIDGVDQEQHLNVARAQALQARRVGQDLRMHARTLFGHAWYIKTLKS